MPSRHEQHYIIMTVIYNELVDFTYGNNDVSRKVIDLITDINPLYKDDNYVIDSISLSVLHYKDIVNKIIPLLQGWTWERIPLLTKAILLMSYTHYYDIEKIDKKIVINEAVSLEKKYVDEKQAKFVNAILDKLLV